MLRITAFILNPTLRTHSHDGHDIIKASKREREREHEQEAKSSRGLMNKGDTVHNEKSGRGHNNRGKNRNKIITFQLVCDCLYLCVFVFEDNLPLLQFLTYFDNDSSQSALLKLSSYSRTTTTHTRTHTHIHPYTVQLPSWCDPPKARPSDCCLKLIWCLRFTLTCAQTQYFFTKLPKHDIFFTSDYSM